MRVVAGLAGGRRLRGPAVGTRPTTDQVREATFNSLNGYGAVEGKHVVDLFAGTGACGIEALSRGAASCVFVDRDHKSVAIVRENLKLTGFEGQRVIASDALAFLRREETASADLVFADPPYGFTQWDEVIASCDAALVVCEAEKEVAAPDGWESLRSRRYGGTTVTMLRRNTEEERNE